MYPIILSSMCHNVLLGVAISFTGSAFMSLMFGVLLFINSSVLLLALGYEFLALINLLVYVGALAVLFLFVIMLMEVPTSELRSYNRGGNRSLQTYLLYSEITEVTREPESLPRGYVPALESLTFVGQAIYVQYADLLILNSLILTLALFGSITVANNNK
jgi:NADH:ubiquinone oxidoreductase subunit 6 (subunit J)